MVATTRSRLSPSPTCTLFPKQEKATVELPKTRAHTRAAVSAKKPSVKEEREEEETCRTPVKRRASVKEEILDEEVHPHEEEDELDAADDEDYGYDSEDEIKTKKRRLQSAPPPVAAAASHYESLRLQRIAENKARMAALGVQRHAATLTSFFQASKPGKRPWKKSQITPIELQRRSDRLKTNSPAPGFYSSPSFAKSYGDEIDESPKLQLVLRNRVYRNYQDEENIRPGNAPLPKNCPADLQVSPVISALRCRSKERGTLYDAIVGICCHFCRQKKLCGEEDCERCGQRDVSKACLGKTDCSKCHSSTGVFCRACLKIRYGEEIEHVREKGDWLCPHCSEEEGLNPYWICNSSICLSRRKMPPTGIAIFKARELGYQSVAHYLADLLERQAGN
eukprot:c20318_g2_i1 orf=50-1231(-)